MLLLTVSELEARRAIRTECSILSITFGVHGLIICCSLNDLMTLPVDDSSDEENEEDDTGDPEEDE